MSQNAIPKRSKRPIILAFSIAVVLGVLSIPFLLFVVPMHEENSLHHQILFESNFAEIKAACRLLLTRKRAEFSKLSNNESLGINLGDPDVPPEISKLHPRLIFARQQYVDLGWGKGFVDPYGIIYTTDPTLIPPTAHKIDNEIATYDYK